MPESNNPIEIPAATTDNKSSSTDTVSALPNSNSAHPQSFAPWSLPSIDSSRLLTWDPTLAPENHLSQLETQALESQLTSIRHKFAGQHRVIKDLLKEIEQPSDEQQKAPEKSPPQQWRWFNPFTWFSCLWRKQSDSTVENPPAATAVKTAALKPEQIYIGILCALQILNAHRPIINKKLLEKKKPEITESKIDDFQGLSLNQQKKITEKKTVYPQVQTAKKAYGQIARIVHQDKKLVTTKLPFEFIQSVDTLLFKYIVPRQTTPQKDIFYFDALIKARGAKILEVAKKKVEAEASYDAQYSAFVTNFVTSQQDNNAKDPLWQELWSSVSIAIKNEQQDPFLKRLLELSQTPVYAIHTNQQTEECLFTWEALNTFYQSYIEGCSNEERQKRIELFKLVFSDQYYLSHLKHGRSSTPFKDLAKFFSVKEEQAALLAEWDYFTQFQIFLNYPSLKSEWFRCPNFTVQTFSTGDALKTQALSTTPETETTAQATTAIPTTWVSTSFSLKTWRNESIQAISKHKKTQCSVAAPLSIENKDEEMHFQRQLDGIFREFNSDYADVVHDLTTQRFNKETAYLAKVAEAHNQCVVPQLTQLIAEQQKEGVSPQRQENITKQITAMNKLTDDIVNNVKSAFPKAEQQGMERAYKFSLIGHLTATIGASIQKFLRHPCVTFSYRCKALASRFAKLLGALPMWSPVFFSSCFSWHSKTQRNTFAFHQSIQEAALSAEQPIKEGTSPTLQQH